MIEEAHGMWPWAEHGRRLILEENGLKKASIALPEHESARVNLYSSDAAIFLVDTGHVYRADLRQAALEELTDRRSAPAGSVYLGCFERLADSRLPIPMFQEASRCPELAAGRQE